MATPARRKYPDTHSKRALTMENYVSEKKYGEFLTHPPNLI